jgi:sugar phosphate isomerase/epimerase
MRLEGLPDEVQLTYCTNIHAGESWAEIAASLDAHVPTIKGAVSPDAPFGLGLRLSGLAAAELLRPARLDAFRAQLERLGAYVFTINAFPFGPFHGTRVKEEVYRPDWRSTDRLAFTRDAARVLAALLPPDSYGSISTVPGAFKPESRTPGAVDLMVENLVRAAADLVRLERETGRTIALALEPEPCCFLETVEETLAFFENRLFAPEALARFGRLADLPADGAERALRDHLGVCYDVCHGAVEYEDPVSALRLLRAKGIRIPKIQLSAAMRVPRMDEDLLAALERFDTGVYLHQVIARGHRPGRDGFERYADLPDAFRALRTGDAQGEWRIHCHVPIFLQSAGDVGSTQQDLVATLRALRQEAFSPHLEVETYTWDVLPRALKTVSKAHDIARELAFVLEELDHERFDGGLPCSGQRSAAAGQGL